MTAVCWRQVMAEDIVDDHFRGDHYCLTLCFSFFLCVLLVDMLLGFRVTGYHGMPDGDLGQACSVDCILVCWTTAIWLLGSNVYQGCSAWSACDMYDCLLLLSSATLAPPGSVTLPLFPGRSCMGLLGGWIVALIIAMYLISSLPVCTWSWVRGTWFVWPLRFLWLRKVVVLWGQRDWKGG